MLILIGFIKKGTCKKAQQFFKSHLFYYLYNFLKCLLIGRVLHDAKTFSTDIRVTLLRLLAYGAIQDDFGMILHMDRKDHFIMNYAKDFESIPILEQEALALFVSIILMPFFSFFLNFKANYFL